MAKQTNEYFDLINGKGYAMSEIGRLLNQDEVDKVVSICNKSGSWGEEHLIEALKEFKNGL